jgi:hypothetical protein
MKFWQNWFKQEVKHYWNKEELPGQWKVSIIVPIYNKQDINAMNLKVSSNILHSKLSPYSTEEFIVGFNISYQVLIRFFCIYWILKRNKSTMRQYISYL